jgi:hypothetical protein
MLTVIVRGSGDPAALAMTLSSLVPGVAEGLVGHGVVLLPHADKDAERIADAMGADVILGDGWAAALPVLRSPWVLLLEAGEALEPDWVGVAEGHLMLHGASGSRGGLFPADGFGAQLAERVRLLFQRPCASGMLIPAARLSSGPPPLRRFGARRRRAG